MPLHMVESDILAGRLKRLVLAGQTGVELPLHVVHERGRQLGRASRWLIGDLRERLATCPGARQRADFEAAGRKPTSVA